ncbi:MAG: HEAT repeat domain-containing protein [Phycisphaerales bacterium]|nr:MAG: HEAT repeat domain-containing protein [Phycisphaerales bacterium]
MTIPRAPRLLATFLLMLIAVPAGFGQTAPEELYAIMSSESISDAQLQQITRWVTVCVRSIGTGQEAALQRARADILALTGPNATPAFRNALAQQFVRQSGSMMNRFSADQSRIVVLALASSRTPEAVDGLLQALSNSDPATRLMAATALAELQGTLGSEPDRVVGRLGEVVRAEPVPVVRAELCRALHLPQYAQTIIPLLAEVITLQTDRYRRDGLGDVAPLLAAVETLSALPTDSLPPNEKPTVVKAVANLVHYAVVMHIGGDNIQDALREDLERIIYRGETLLARILATEGVSNTPKVADAMMAGGDDSSTAMRTQLDRWLGDGNAPGVLTAAPWSVPSGGGFPEAKLP